MAEEINIHVATDLNTEKLPIKTVNNISPDSNGNIEITNATDPNAVHKTGNETINGVKSFNDMIKANNGTVQVGADTGYSVTFNYNGNIVSKQARGTYNIFLPDANGTLALTSDIDGKANDNNVVHKSGNETIGGDKAFTNPIFRKADITTSTVETVYKFTDSNANPCGSIYNRMHWYNNNIYNRHQAYNATSGKDMYFEVLSANDGSGVVNTGGSVTNNKNLTTVTSDTGSTYVATMGWVNNPETSTNVVHRSGDETIAGNKTFSNRVSFPSGYYMTTDANDNSLRIIRDGSNHGNNYKIIIQGNDGKIFAPNGFKGNLEGNVETSSLLVNSDTFKHIGSNNGVQYVHTLPKFDGELLGATFVETSNGWYRKHSDGFIEQFFYVDYVKTFEEKTINFHIPFTTIHYNVSVIGSRYCSTDPNKTDDLVFTTGDETPTYTKLYVYDGGDNNYSTVIKLYVCGY